MDSKDLLLGLVSKRFLIDADPVNFHGVREERIVNIEPRPVAADGHVKNKMKRLVKRRFGVAGICGPPLIGGFG